MIELLKEQWLIRQLAEINRAAVPQRVLFGKGAGALGSFQPYMTMNDCTAAHFLSDPELETPVFVRFSKAMDTGGESGRDLREFTVRFYTEEGNFDLFAYSLPVFFIAEPEKLPRLIRALARDPESNLRRTEQFWQFAAGNPETMNMLLHLYSDEGTLKSYRTMAGYSPFALCLVNRKGERFLTRFRLTPLSGVRSIARQEAEFLAGFDDDVASRDLYETLDEGGTVEYELSAQMVPAEKAGMYPFSLTDPTKRWPEEQMPLTQIGKIKLTSPIRNYLSDVEKADLSPANLVSGIEFSTDPMLTVLSFFMEDAQRRRLGADSALLPVNRRRGRGKISAVPPSARTEQEIDSSQAGEEKERREWELSVRDVYRQAEEYYRGMSGEQKKVLADNIADSMMFLDEVLQEEMTAHFSAVSGELGKQIAKSLAF